MTLAAHINRAIALTAVGLFFSTVAHAQTQEDPSQQRAGQTAESQWGQTQYGGQQGWGQAGQAGSQQWGQQQYQPQQFGQTGQWGQQQPQQYGQTGQWGQQQPWGQQQFGQAGGWRQQLGQRLQQRFGQGSEQVQQAMSMTQDKLRRALTQSGFQNIQILDAAYLVHATTRDGDFVVMLVNPPASVAMRTTAGLGARQLSGQAEMAGRQAMQSRAQQGGQQQSQQQSETQRSGQDQSESDRDS